MAWKDCGHTTGVYDCQWGTDTIRVVVAGELAREPHNAALHLFSASPDLVGYGSAAYRRRSEETSVLVEQLFERFHEEGFPMAYTMEDFKRDYIKEHFSKLTPAERREVLESLPAEERRVVLNSLPAQERRVVLKSLPAEELLGVLSTEQIRQYLEQLTPSRPAQPRKPRRKR